MPCPIRHRSRSAHPAARVFQTLVDRGFLEARLAAIGGQRSVLLRHQVEGDPPGRASFAVRQVVAGEKLHPMLRKALKGSLAIQRSEQWHHPEPGYYTAAVEAGVAGAPGRITGRLELRDVAGGCQLGMDGSVTVPLPFVGPRLETVIAEQVEHLLAKETRFTWDWMSR